MLTTDQIRRLARGSVLWGPIGGGRAPIESHLASREAALEAIGRPEDDAIVAAAIGALASPDRNLRVAALRILRWYDRPEVRDAVLRATHDPVRRVRRIAVNLVPVDHPGAASRLREIVDDPREYHRIRGEALGRLASRPGKLPEEALVAVRDLLDTDAHRRRILFFLVTRPVDDAARDLLRDIVRIGTKGEAVIATRSLCGQRATHLNLVPPERRQEVQRTCDPADLDALVSRGMLVQSKQSVYYWLPAAPGS